MCALAHGAYIITFRLAKSLQNIPAVHNNEYNSSKLQGNYITCHQKFHDEIHIIGKRRMLTHWFFCRMILALRQPYEHTMRISGIYDEVVRMNR